MLTNDTLEVVVPHDEAVDLARSKITEYGLTRKISCLQFKPGMTPTRYQVRRIPRSLFLRFVDMPPTDNEKFVRAFLVGVEHIDALRVDDHGNVTTLRPTRELSTNGSMIYVFDDDVLEQVPPDDVYDIGSVAYHRAFLAPGRKAYYRLPPSSRHAFQRRVFHDAGGLQAAEAADEALLQTRQELRVPVPKPTPSATALDELGIATAKESCL